MRAAGQDQRGRERERERERPRPRLFMISVAAELAGMHPQTLRVYEARGLINPQRSSGNTRLYSERDVARLQRIQQLTAEGMNLAGAERVIRLEENLDAALSRIRQLESALRERRPSTELVVYQARPVRGASPSQRAQEALRERRAR